MAVLYEKQNRIVTLTLNRPEVLNAFNRTMHEELNESFVRFREDEDAWVAIVTGSGEKAFSSGQDLKELDAATEKGDLLPSLWESYFGKDLQGGLEVSKPIIAAINGYCIGEGLCLALACDLRIAAKSATFSFPEVVLGIPTIVGAIRASQLLGLGHALELLLLGEQRDAAWAFRTGLVNTVVRDETLRDEALSWAKRLCAVGPVATRATKEVAIRSRSMSFQDTVRMGEAIRRVAMATEDAKEGIAAAAQKRKPDFKGR